MTVQLAAVILTKNEERHIAECLDSLAWADLRVVYDAFSTDRTVEIAAERGAMVMQHPFRNFADQRNSALEAIEAKWVFFVDADERATPVLAEEVMRVIQFEDDRARAGWWVPRHNYMIGHRMRGGGWYPDHQLRLLRRSLARYDPHRPVHETVELNGQAGHLENVLIHYNYDTVAQFRRKMNQYTGLEAQILYEQGVQVWPWTYATMPVREFWRRLAKLQGYRDHIYGLLFCGLMGWYTYVTYRRLRTITRSAKEA